MDTPIETDGWCGQVLPGEVNDPCQHSVIALKCCLCAGCAEDRWWCGRQQMAVTLRGQIEYRLKTKTAIAIYILLGVILVSSGVLVVFVEALTALFALIFGLFFGWTYLL